MSEIANNTQCQQSKISKLAITSILLAIVGIFVIFLRVGAYRPWWSEFVARNIIGLSGIVGLLLGMAALARISKPMGVKILLVILFSFFLFCLTLARGLRAFIIVFLVSLPCLVGLLIGAAVLRWVPEPTRKLRGRGFAILGAVLAACLWVFWWMETCGPVSTALSQACGNNLRQLGKAMLIYGNNDRRGYPHPNQWCDLLLKNTQVSAERFFCPAVKFKWRRQVCPWPIPKNESCYYAMNPNCEPNSPSDTVLLFETNGGWNQFGGQEILTTENHKGRCHVLFNDGHVEFVKPEKIEKLRWKDQEVNK